MKKKYSTLTIISICINIILLLVGIWYFVDESTPRTSSTIKLYAQYPFLSKRVFIKEPSDKIINFNSLRGALQYYLQSTPTNSFGFYFEYLPTGASVGINEKMEARWASLIKVPIVMAMHKQIELGKYTENQQVPLLKEDLDDKYGDLWKKGAGAQVSIKELVDLSITHSDNTAYSTLLRLLTDEDVNDVYDSLDIPRDLENAVPIITPKNYSSILRALYLATYLSTDDSQDILQLMTQTIFTDKLPAGVPSGIPVAHKIGVFAEIDSKQSIYHDCGIVYIPNRPYLLCMMYKGSEVEATKHMKNVSQLIYTFVSKTKVKE